MLTDEAATAVTFVPSTGEANGDTTTGSPPWRLAFSAQMMTPSETILATRTECLRRWPSTTLQFLSQPADVQFVVAPVDAKETFPLSDITPQPAVRCLKDNPPPCLRAYGDFAERNHDAVDVKIDSRVVHGRLDRLDGRYGAVPLFFAVDFLRASQPNEYGNSASQDSNR